jgi:hypothetical protein
VTQGFALSYLSRQKLFYSAIPDRPSEKTGLIVVIPVFCEPDITETLESLWKCDRPSCDTEVILVINAPENASAEIIENNRITLDAADKWIKKHQDNALRFFIINELFPAKDAGVGLARKSGMDEALRRFSSIGKRDGFILSFDADSTCDENYFTAIEDTLRRKPSARGFDIYFEHPLEGDHFPQNVYKAITQYELHLRYVNLYLRFTGFPHAHHTIGSCFGVRADIYASQGGMNKRKGGEDFYFLHKVIPLGDFEKITSTRVIPSPRDSFRVPFGTGPVIRKLTETGAELETYDPKVFRILKVFFQMIPQFYKTGKSNILSLTENLEGNMKTFLEINDHLAAIDEINRNSGSPYTFCNRFFRWFDAFRIVKYLNYSAMNFFPKLPVTMATPELLKDLDIKSPDTSNAPELLLKLRKIERGSSL